MPSGFEANEDDDNYQVSLMKLSEKEKEMKQHIKTTLSGPG